MAEKAGQSGKGAAGARDRGADTGAAGRDSPPVEKGGPKGPEPTRFGDWEKNGRCTDF